MKRILLGMAACAVLLTGCGSKSEQTASEIVPETMKETETVTEAITESTVSVTETNEMMTEAETIPISEEDTAMAIELLQNAMDALKNYDADGIVQYTNFNHMYYLTEGIDETDTEAVKAKVEEFMNASFFEVFSGDFEIHAVKRTPELTATFMDYLQKSMPEESRERIENAPIEDVITITGTMSYPENEGDTGMLFLLKTNGEWRFDVCYSFSMEASGLWDDYEYITQ